MSIARTAKRFWASNVAEPPRRARALQTRVLEAPTLGGLRGVLQLIDGYAVRRGHLIMCDDLLLARFA